MNKKHARNLSAIILISTLTFMYFLITFSFKPIIISSNSMVPALNVGDVVFVDEINDFSTINADLKKGDIVVVENKDVFIENGVPSYVFAHLDNSTPIIHRAIESYFINNSFFFITKGDNNEYADGCIRYKEIVNDSYITIEFNISNPVLINQVDIKGKIIFVIPLLGYLKLYSPFILLYISSLSVIIYYYNKKKKGSHYDK